MGDRPLIDELRIADAPEAWRAAGFTVDGDVCRVGTVHLRLDDDGTGITGWTLRNVAAATTSVDAIPTTVSSAPADEPATHQNGVIRIDHVVLMTPDLRRSTDALVALGLDAVAIPDQGALPVKLAVAAVAAPGDRLLGLREGVRSAAAIGRIDDPAVGHRRPGKQAEHQSCDNPPAHVPSIPASLPAGDRGRVAT